MTAIRRLWSFVSYLFLFFVILALTFVFVTEGTVHSVTNDWSSLDQEVYVRNWRQYAPHSTNSLPEVVFLSQGPGTFTTPLDNFIVKTSPIDFVFEPGPTYTSQSNERIWGVRGADNAPPAIWDGITNLGPGEAGCIARYVGIDDDLDERINWFELNGEPIDVVTQGMVFSGSFMIPEDGEIIFVAKDTVGGWFLPCDEHINIVDFSAWPISGLPSLTVSFTIGHPEEFDDCLWDFGDGSSSSDCNPSHTYNNPGTFTVSLWIQGLGGEYTVTKIDYITVYEPVEADFSASPASGILPLEVDFTNLSSGDFDQCLWDFGDGNSSEVCNDPSHIYGISGTFTTTLKVDGLGGNDMMIKTDYINVYEPAKADFDASPTSGLQPLAVDFTNLSSGDFDQCQWDFGDGNSSEVCNDPSHVYDISGTFTITLRVDGPGGNDMMIRSDYIAVFEPVNADFSASPETGAPPLVVYFTNLSTGNFDQCLWNFGDGETVATCNNSKHVYKDEGDYSVSLTVKGSGGEDTMTVEQCVYISYYRFFLPSLLKASS